MTTKCQGWPQYGCTKQSIATVAGFRLCRECLNNYTRRDLEKVIAGLRDQLTAAYAERNQWERRARELESLCADKL